MFVADKLFVPIKLVESIKIAAGKLITIFCVDTPNLLFNDPNKDFPASFLAPLNLVSFFLFAISSFDNKSFSNFKSSKVKNSENGFVLKSLVSLCTTSLSKPKFVLVN